MNDLKIISKASNSHARTAQLETAHGSVDTPVFMPVGTRGTVKGLLPDTIKQTGTKVVLANTYHMLLRPGVEAVEALGGLHKLMAWDGPILTDSGGYQVFSLSTINRIGEDGVEFASHIDGTKIYLDAKIATQVQNRLGADIIMCFDECTPFPCEADKLKKAVDRTIRWAGRCRQAHSNDKQLLFGIVQGGIDQQLRKTCSQELIEMDFDGYAVGGLSVGEGHQNMIKTVEFTAPLLPENKPRYLMGAGMPADIVAAVKAGIDMFDCVLPTRNGRNGFAFTNNGPLKLRNSENTQQTKPVDENCQCYCCQNFSRGAIRHFFNVGEMLGPILLSIHNITYFQKLLEKIRETINDDTFDEWAKNAIENDKYSTTDL